MLPDQPNKRYKFLGTQSPRLCNYRLSGDDPKPQNYRLTLKSMKTNLSESDKSEIIEMALSDHASFENIKEVHGLSESEVKALMRSNLKTGSYKAWRKRVRTFSDRRENYK